jgi:hypothetical protein
MALGVCPSCGYPTIGANMCAACSLTPVALAQWPMVLEDAAAPAA